MKVKICGIRTLEEARLAIDAGADALGFLVDVGEAKCAVGTATASAIISGLPPFVSSVVVSTSTDSKALIRLAKATGANTLQLQGPVTPDIIRAVKAVFFNMKVYAAVHVADGSALENARELGEAADAIILDSADKGALGGTGKVHDWDISKQIVEASSLPVILAGGLNPENIAEAVRKVRPYAVDVRTGVSNPDGSKDIEKVRLFIERAKSA